MSAKVVWRSGCVRVVSEVDEWDDAWKQSDRETDLIYTVFCSGCHQVNNRYDFYSRESAVTAAEQHETQCREA